MVCYRVGDSVCIGEITGVCNSSLTVLVYNGNRSEPWLPLLIGEKKYDTVIDRSNIVDDMIFKLTASKKLPIAIDKKLKEIS